MILLKITGIALITVVAVLTVRTYKPEYAFAVSLCGSAVCFFVAASYLASYISALWGFFADYGVSSEYFSVAIKALGIGYMAEFAADTARDAGQSAIASKIVFAGRVCIFVLALPLVKNLLDVATKLVGI